MYVIVSYDIPNDKRRTQVAKMLKDFVRRMQYSVFEGELTADQVSTLKTRISEYIKPDKDRVRAYELCSTCKQKTTIFGQGEIYSDPEVYIF
ncbi:MAG: CRISPR-associated endonuclease Cas2 [Desulfobacterales bacterium]